MTHFVRYVVLLLQQTINVFEIVKTVIHEEFQFGDDAQLVTHAFSQFEADSWNIAVDIFDNLCASF